MATLKPKILVIDDFLASAELHALLAYALASESAFQPTIVIDKTGNSGPNQKERLSLHCSTGLGQLETPFRKALERRFSELCSGTGTPPFPIVDYELELAAHNDGAFYKPHIDTITDRQVDIADSLRTLTTVFYFHRDPKAFSGGELAIYPFASVEPFTRIEPRQNRLVAFSSIVLHEVLPISCPSRAFADSRFAVNAWLRRSR